jgi:hypothetical protein
MIETIKNLFRSLAAKLKELLLRNRLLVKLTGRFGLGTYSETVFSFTERHGAIVVGGPFAGMKYALQATGSALLPKLVGSYEAELHGSALEHILSTSYDTVVDVGCAEGYYAVGLALKLPSTTRIYAFDTAYEAQLLCRALASINNMEQKIVVSGFCDTGTLQSTLNGRSLVICDCEGYEIDLLQPTAAPLLVQSDILVELHETSQPGLTKTIWERFRATHNILAIDTQERSTADYPTIAFLRSDQQRLALAEFRPFPQQWLFMTPVEHGASR